MTNTLTLETLIAKGACAEAKEKFAKIFPNGALVAVATFVNVAREFNWDCAAQLLLSPRNQVRFKELVADATDTYDAACEVACEAAYNAAHTAYIAACAAYTPAYATYTDAHAAYSAACEAARNAYNASCDACDAAYVARDTARNVAFATAFAELYIQQESKKS